MHMYTHIYVYIMYIYNHTCSFMRGHLLEHVHKALSFLVDGHSKLPFGQFVLGEICSSGLIEERSQNE